MIFDNLSDDEKELFKYNLSIDYWDSVAWQIKKILDQEAKDLSYIGPFRDNPERVYRDQEKKSTSVGVRGENVSTILINDYNKKKDVIEKISTWLYQSIGYRIAVKDLGSSLFQIMIEDKKGLQVTILLLLHSM